MTNAAAIRRSMESNRRRDTKPERLLRSELHRRGLRYRVDMRVQGQGGFARPDIAFTRRRVAVFVDGCFWHSCPEHRSVPSGVTAKFWQEKLAKNRLRDLRDTRCLEDAGWQVIRVWEHEAIGDAADRVQALVGSSRLVS